MFYDFCHHCGAAIEQNQVDGQVLVCNKCGQTIGVVSLPKQVVVDRTEEAIQSGAAARCSSCGQAVELKDSGGVRSFVPHFVAGQRKMCALSGKPLPKAEAPVVRGKDLSAWMTRDVIRVIACRRDTEPTIEELTLEYLDKSDRVRLQIEALREILGSSFQMKPYPAALQRPQFAVWGNAAMCVVAKKHEQGGYQAAEDRELREVINDLRRAEDHQRFFTASAQR